MSDIKKKYRIPVGIQAFASTSIGWVEVDTLEEFEEAADKLWESQQYDSPTINISNDFDLGDWDLSERNDSDLEHYKNDDA